MPNFVFQSVQIVVIYTIGLNEKYFLVVMIYLVHTATNLNEIVKTAKKIHFQFEKNIYLYTIHNIDSYKT